MGTSASFILCKSASSVKIRKANARIIPAATASRTVFGVSLDVLQERHQMVSGVPLVVRNIVDFLDKYGLRQKGLFRISGSVQKAKLLKTMYNLGEKVDLMAAGDIHTAASLLKLFLRELPQALIPQLKHMEMVQRFREGLDETELNCHLKAALRGLPEDHYSTLSYLCHFLLRVASYSQENLMPLENLAPLFGPCIFHVPDGRDMLEEQSVCNALTEYLLKNHSVLLGVAMDAPDPPVPSTPSLFREKSHIPTVASEPCVCVSEESSGQIGARPGTSGSGLELLRPALTVPCLASEGDTKEKVPAVPGVEEERGPQTDLLPLGDRGMPEAMVNPTQHQPSSSNTVTPSIADFQRDACSEVLEEEKSSDVAESKELHGSDQLGRATVSNKVVEDSSDVRGTEKMADPHSNSEGTQGGVALVVPGEEEESEGQAQYRSLVPQTSHEEEDGSENQRLPGDLHYLGDNSAALQSLGYFSVVQSHHFHGNPQTSPSLPEVLKICDATMSEHPVQSGETLPVSMSPENTHVSKKKLRKSRRRVEWENQHRLSRKGNAIMSEVMKSVKKPTSTHKHVRDVKSKRSVAQPGKQTEEVPKCVCSSSYDLQGAVMQQQSPLLEETVHMLMKKLQEKRRARSIPDSVKAMTHEEMALEKATLQKCLLYFESLHGRPGTREGRRLMRPLYDRYHSLKQHLSSAHSSSLSEVKGRGSGEKCMQCGVLNTCAGPSPVNTHTASHKDRHDTPSVNSDAIIPRHRERSRYSSTSSITMSLS